MSMRVGLITSVWKLRSQAVFSTRNSRAADLFVHYGMSLRWSWARWWARKRATRAQRKITTRPGKGNPAWRPAAMIAGARPPPTRTSRSLAKVRLSPSPPATTASTDPPTSHDTAADTLQFRSCTLSLPFFSLTQSTVCPHLSNFGPLPSCGVRCRR